MKQGDFVRLTVDQLLVPPDSFKDVKLLKTESGMLPVYEAWKRMGHRGLVLASGVTGTVIERTPKGRCLVEFGFVAALVREDWLRHDG